MKWFERDIIYSSQIGDFTRKELEHIVRNGNEIKIVVRQNPRGNILPLLEQERKGRRKEHCCYIINLTEITVKDIITLIMVKILNIHWIEICQ